MGIPSPDKAFEPKPQSPTSLQNIGFSSCPEHEAGERSRILSTALGKNNFSITIRPKARTRDGAS